MPCAPPSGPSRGPAPAQSGGAGRAPPTGHPAEGGGGKPGGLLDRLRRQEVRPALHQVLDVVDQLFINPMPLPVRPGPAPESGPEGRAEVRLSDFRLCVDVLRDSLEAYFVDGGRDKLCTAEEAVSEAEEALQRIAELTFAQRRETSSASGRVLRPSSFSDACDGRLVHSLLNSGLGVAGLLEACFGELTAWGQLPSDGDRREWAELQRKYERVLRKDRDDRGLAPLSWMSDAGRDHLCCVSHGLERPMGCCTVMEPVIQEVRPALRPLCTNAGSIFCAPMCARDYPLAAKA